MKHFRLLFVLLMVSSLVVGCSARMPTPKTARATSISYFKKYGRKYPHTQFGNKNLSNISINGMQEISYHFALVDTIITFVDGHAARALVRMQNRFPGGWRVVSWELAGYQ